MGRHANPDIAIKRARYCVPPTRTGAALNPRLALRTVLSGYRRRRPARTYARRSHAPNSEGPRHVACLRCVLPARAIAAEDARRLSACRSVHDFDDARRFCCPCRIPWPSDRAPHADHASSPYDSLHEFRFSQHSTMRASRLLTQRAAARGERSRDPRAHPCWMP